MGSPEKTESSQPLQSGFRLEALEINPRTGVVCGPGGSERLNPKVMDVLVMMTRHPREVVTRDELLERLWPNRVVTDDAVTRCFYHLRRQLSQAGGDPHYRTLIETLPKRGYRFNGEIGSLLPVPPVATPGVERHRPWAIAFVIFAAIALIAVAGQ
jgi:DNA-binding winged helix-turn-helix (wHTH) protein